MNKKIQILRAMAIFAVVLIHVDAKGWSGLLLRPLFNFPVAMFIFLSGYLTKLQIPDLKSFYVKRISRVLIPYVLWSILATVVSGSYKNFLINFITANTNSVYYYIFVYIQLVLITPLVTKLLLSRHRWIGWCITPVTILIVRYILPSMGIVPGFPFPNTNFLVWFCFYYLGLALGNHVVRSRCSIKIGVILYLAAILLSEAEGLWFYTHGDAALAKSQLKISTMLASSIAAYLAHLYIRSDKKPLRENCFTKLLVLIGDCSFGVYLSHMFVLTVFKHMPYSSFVPFPADAVLVLAVSVFCVWMGKKILGKKIGGYLGL